jgi:hypothetical protein
MIRILSIRDVVLATTLLVAQPVPAAIDNWRIDEVFSNADGSVQFVELIDQAEGENFIQGQLLTASTGSFSVPNDLPAGSTLGHHLLFATPGFSSLLGGVIPDYTIESHFFNPSGDTIDWGSGSNEASFGAVPIDGRMSLGIPSHATMLNSPTNFFGGSGSVTLTQTSAGDYNQDGIVNAADYTVWRDTLGSSTDLRANGDNTGASAGVIDQADYTVWTQNFGHLPGTGRPVPEPTAIVLFAIGLLATWIHCYHVSGVGR